MLYGAQKGFITMKMKNAAKTLTGRTGSLLLAMLLVGAILPLHAQNLPPGERFEPSDVPWDPALLEQSDKAIYGEDDRIDVYEETDPERRAWAASVAAIVPAQFLVRDGRGNYVLNPLEYGFNGIPVCDDVRFAGQPIGATCTAFMVGSDIIATAGHCLFPFELDNYYIVFGYEMEDEDTPILVFSPNQVYEVEEIIDWALMGPLDHALFRVDRPITAPEATPLPLRRDGQIELDENVGTIGHPTGLPKKIAFGEDTVVTENSHPFYFGANIDVFGGNSGGPVFNAETGLVEGIAVRSSFPEFEMRGNCTDVVSYPDDHFVQTEVSRSVVFAELVPESAFDPAMMEFKVLPTLTNNGNPVVAASWVLPTLARFQQVHLVRSAGHFPTSLEDGRVLVSGDDIESYVDRNVQSGVTYFYSLIAEVDDPIYPLVIAHDTAKAGELGKPELTQGFGVFSEDNIPVSTLEYSQITFTPVDAPRGELGTQRFVDNTSYEVTFTPDVYELPVPRRDSQGQAYRLHLTNDGIANFRLGESVPFFGRYYSNVFFGANGFISFRRLNPDSELNFPSLESHLALPRISYLFTDLSPDAGGELWARELEDRVVFTMQNVVERRGGFAQPAPHPSTVQVELFYSGHIRLTYLELGAQDAIVGISAGRGLPFDVTELAADLQATPIYIDFENKPEIAQRISVDPIPNKWVYAGQTVRFDAQARVPEHATGAPKLTAEWTGSGPAPFGDNGDGTGSFVWRTSFLDSGDFTVRIHATLNNKTAYQDVKVTVYDVFFKPEARNLAIATGKPGEDPTASRTVELEDRLTARYEFYHPLAEELAAFYGEGPTMLYWFRNGTKMPGLTNSRSVPPSFTQGGDQWTFRVIPYTSTYIRGLDAVSPVVTVSAAPTITSVSPATGPKEGGYNVILRGHRFDNTLEVRFGSAKATQFQVLNNESIEVITPRNPAGPVDVYVRTQKGEGVLHGGYTYLEPGETIIKADVNNDGRVDAQDLQLVINALLGLDNDEDADKDLEINPDVNRDGVVNAQDVQLVIKHSLGR